MQNYKKLSSSSSAMDRLTTLPDTILLHIFSFLPFDDVVRTTRVCKQFHFLWTLSSSLIFTFRGHSNPNDLHSLRRFISFVDKSLLLLNTTNNHQLSKFHLDFPFHLCFSGDVTLWLTFTHIRKVKELTLALSNGECEIENQYILTKRFGENPVLEKLNLAFCSFRNVEEIQWGALKELKIESTVVSDDLIRKFVLGCPLLDVFELRNCYGFERLDFDQVGLTKLVIDGYWEMEAINNYAPLEIWGPSVRVLEILGGFSRRRILLGDVSGVAKVKLDYWLSKDEFDAAEVEQQMVISMLVSLHHAKDVSLGTWCIEVLSRSDMHGLPFRLADCKRLVLQTPIQRRYIPGVLRLLQFSPNVGTLVIHLSLPYFEFEAYSSATITEIYKLGGNYWTSGIFRFFGPYLKHIHITGFVGRRIGFEVPFLQFLLKNSAVLEKMLIQGNMGHQKLTRDIINEQHQVAQTVQNFPRTSKSAVITFEF